MPKLLCVGGDNAGELVEVGHDQIRHNHRLVAWKHADPPSPTGDKEDVDIEIATYKIVVLNLSHSNLYFLVPEHGSIRMGLEELMRGYRELFFPTTRARARARDTEDRRL